ncbi:hypothetical protein [Actinocorallia libanotica]|uniref:TLP18.3/Psb32/MOLO-1 phosphatase superfamily protein n=1 Tax=Actinocorallia libanotica TaxID=46162 RepID=A0ABN1R7R6_9ACTN
MRAAACWLAAVLVVLLAPAGASSADETPYALVRLERVATALKADPLFVDDELVDLVDRGERGRIKKAIRKTGERLGMPVFVIVIPNPPDSEADGRDDVFLHWLHGQLGRDGLYLMVDEDANLEVVPFQVPRELGHFVIPQSLANPADRKEPFVGLVPRIEQAFAEVLDAPSAAPGTPELYSEADPFGEEPPPREPEIWGPFFGGLLVLGPIAAVLLLLLLVLGRGVYRMWRRPPTASDQPRVRRLHAQAEKELTRLAALLPPPEEAEGGPVALRSYDAARIVYDDVGPRPKARDDEAALDLVGVIVLARQGREVLEKGLLRPLAPCRVNPLHGPGILKRPVVGLPAGKICRSCADADARERVRRVLRLPGGRRYHEVKEGRWQRGFGGQDLAKRVLESLGVG